MKITIKTLASTTKTFELEPTDLVLKVRLLISEWLRVSCHRNSLRLHHLGDGMDNNRTFESYGILDDTTITVSLSCNAISFHDYAY
ncbi:hypothetical protein I4U23_004750 [Adineta vaga]|nr:hypothetical protein I4U23_004750 [Adineta vaga]